MGDKSAPHGLSNSDEIKRNVRGESEEEEEEVDQEADDESYEVHVNDEEEEQQDNCCKNSTEDQTPGPFERAPDNSHDQLEVFRQQWQIELQQKSGSREQSPHTNARSTKNIKGSSSQQSEAVSREDMARAFFIQGMEAEDDGMLNEAIYYYRKALQLVPDIESKLGNMFQHSPRDRARQDSESSVEGIESEEMVIDGLDKLRLVEKGLCQMEYEQRMTHISCLPVELVIYILHWVVSNDLDLRSLDMFAMVCKGFYMCARDERVWKKACQKVWGLNLGSCKKFGNSWRRMMIERPHLLFDGCYISKVTYVRPGEQGLDNFYRPFHLVEYFRYIRFFPNGQVLMLVSPEDPLQSLPKLKNSNSQSPGILKGGYRMADSKVTCLLKRVRTESHSNQYRYKRQQRQANNQADESCYVVECDIVSSGRRAHAQLVWKSYAIQNISKLTGEQVHNQFDLNKRSFPPLIFSRVKSYTSTSSEPLT
ncbi:F-box only protein 9 [Elysia marginata]|uniref:F-box only protein 9 n=1 Tax=Elysia marginata TaxID=1093978 RepID=A0AAV4FF58_9GAST|nr:F-box only protein 9 [Elysia marginata]